MLSGHLAGLGTNALPGKRGDGALKAAQTPVNEVAKGSFSRGAAMIRDEDAARTGYVFVDLNTNDCGGFVQSADAALRQQLKLPTGYSYRWSGEYEFELRAKQRLKLILLRRDEAHCHFHRRGHGNFDSSGADSGAGVFRHEEGARARQCAGAAIVHAEFIP